jgi:drug/metabolite transporter (DMT)-like permease
MHMSLNSYLPFVSTLVMLIFAVSVFQRYFVRHNPAFLYWGIGLLMFGSGSFAEAYLALAWSPVVFFMWYVFGAALNAAWLGHGTLNLLVKKKWVAVVTVLLIAGSVVVAVMMATTPLDTSQYMSGLPISEQYRVIMPAHASVRLTTPFFNTYGMLTLVGGAIYSAYLFWRKRVLPNRVIGNVLIAVGALSIAFASSLTRLGIGQYLYIGELLAAILMYVGFRMAAGPRSEPAKAPEATASASADR